MLVCDIAFQCIVVKCARGVLAEYVSIHSVGNSSETGVFGLR